MTPSSPTSRHSPPRSASSQRPPRPSRPAESRSSRSAAPIATARVSATSRGSTATCSCMTWDPIWSVSRSTPYYGPSQVIDVPTSSSMADGSEWRTPPLWGFRDSAPYLHDGRARNLGGAVRAHKGQASGSAARFVGLSLTRQAQIEKFLNSLTAPPSAAPTAQAEREDHVGSHRSVLGPSSSSPSTGPRTMPVRTDARARADQERLAASRLRLAQNLEKMGKPQGAIVFYREIVRDAPETAAARTAAARIKALVGNDECRKDQ